LTKTAPDFSKNETYFLNIFLSNNTFITIQTVIILQKGSYAQEKLKELLLGEKKAQIEKNLNYKTQPLRLKKNV